MDAIRLASIPAVQRWCSGRLGFLYININLSQSILNCGRIFDICVVSSYNREVKAMLYRSGFYGPVRL